MTEPTIKKRYYDFMTWFTTCIFIAYNMAPFFLLELGASAAFYRSVGWIGHIVGKLELRWFMPDSHTQIKQVDRCWSMMTISRGVLPFLPDKIHFHLLQIITSQSDLHLWHYQSSTNSICIQRADRRMKTRSDQEEEEVSKVLKRRGAPRKSKPPECPPKTRKTYESNDYNVGWTTSRDSPTKRVIHWGANWWLEGSWILPYSIAEKLQFISKNAIVE